MALTAEQQAIELISRAKRLLIITKEHAPIDAIASISGLLGFLKNINLQVDAVAPGADLTTVPRILSQATAIQPAIGPMRAFELSLNVTHTPLRELFYDVKDNKLTITVIPKTGEWTPLDVSFKPGKDRYDVILALDCQDLASLGTLFHEHADFLYRTPIINLDRDPGNEHWGQINLIDLTAVSTSEILFRLCDEWNRASIDDTVATAFLAGMIAKTQSFRTMNVTPKTLQIASQLMSLGAKREEIVHGLWRNRSVPTLKLWGRALSRLEQDNETGIVWTSLNRHDFIDVGVDEHALDGIMTELINYAPEAKITVLFYEDANVLTTGARAIINAAPPFSAQEIGRAFGANGTRERIAFSLIPGATLESGVQLVIQRVKETVKRLHL